jgi:hypothetical protein
MISVLISSPGWGVAKAHKLHAILHDTTYVRLSRIRKRGSFSPKPPVEFHHL